MTNSETNTASRSSGFVSDALSRLHLLGFAHAGTLAAMRCVSPVCPSARMSVRVCASLSLSSTRRLRAHSVRMPVCLPDGFPPAPRPRLVSLPPTLPHGPPHAAGGSAVLVFMRRFALTRRGCRQSERTPNHALQRTATRVTLAAARRPAAFAHPAPAMSPQPARRAPQSLSLGSLGVLRPLFRELHQQ